LHLDLRRRLTPNAGYRAMGVLSRVRGDGGTFDPLRGLPLARAVECAAPPRPTAITT